MKKNIFLFCFSGLNLLFLMSTNACSTNENTNGNQVNNTSDSDSVEIGLLQKYPTEDEIKIISFNVRCETSESDTLHNWKYRKDACVDMIKDQKPTLIGFQEAVYSSQWSYLKEHLANDYDGFGVGRDDGAEKGECMGILYRKDIIEKIKGGTFWLSETPDQPSIGFGAICFRCATWGIFKYKPTSQYFLYMNTHLAYTPDSKSLDRANKTRSEEMRVVMSKMKEYNPNGYPQFLTGDFNNVSDDTIFNKIKTIMFDARDQVAKSDNYNSFNAWGNLIGYGLIDHVFYSKSLKAIEFHTIIESYDSCPYLSDHYPVYAIIKF